MQVWSEACVLQYLLHMMETFTTTNVQCLQDLADLL